MVIVIVICSLIAGINSLKAKRSEIKANKLYLGSISDHSSL